MEVMKEEGVNPNTHIFNSAITACARCDMWEKALELFEEMARTNVKRDVVTYNAILDATCSQQVISRRLFQEGIEKGYYAKISRVGTQWLELDLHFMSLGGGEVALGWWLEEGILPVLQNGTQLSEVNSIGIVTGYGRTRQRGARDKGDGMRKRVQAQLQFMNIKEEQNQNKGRVHILKQSLIDQAEANNGRLRFDAESYQQFKAEHTTAHTKPTSEQIRRPREGAPRKDETFTIPPGADNRSDMERAGKNWRGGYNGGGRGGGGRGGGRGGYHGGGRGGGPDRGSNNYNNYGGNDRSAPPARSSGYGHDAYQGQHQYDDGSSASSHGRGSYQVGHHGQSYDYDNSGRGGGGGGGQYHHQSNNQYASSARNQQWNERGPGSYEYQQQWREHSTSHNQPSSSYDNQGYSHQDAPRSHVNNEYDNYNYDAKRARQY